jgi:hypothetical protein
MQHLCGALKRKLEGQKVSHPYSERETWDVASGGGTGSVEGDKYIPMETNKVGFIHQCQSLVRFGLQMGIRETAELWLIHSFIHSSVSMPSCEPGARPSEKRSGSWHMKSVLQATTHIIKG